MNKLNEEQKVALFIGTQVLFLFLTLLSLILFEITTIEEVGIPTLVLFAFVSFFCFSSVFFLRRP